MGRLNRAESDNLVSILNRMGWRLRLHDGWLLAQRALPIAILAALLTALAGRVWPIADLFLWTMAPLALWLVIIPALALFRPLPAMRVARRVDDEAELKERLSTALVLSTYTTDAAHSAFHPELLARQREDALSAGGAVSVAQTFPLRWLHRPLALSSGLAVAVLVLMIVPNPMDAILAERAAVAGATAQEAAHLEDLSEEIASAEELTPEERADLVRQLQETAEALRANEGDREEALADLSALEEELRRRLDANPASSQEALDTLAAQLQALAESQREESSASADTAKALEALAELLDSLSPEEQESLAQSLAQLAGQAAQAGAAELAQAIASLAQAAQNGDSDSAAQAAQAVAAALSAGESDAAAQARLQETLDEIGEGRQAVASAGSQPGSTVAQEDPNAGQNGAQNAGANPGQGQNAGSGGGADVDRLPGTTGSGQAGSPRGIGETGGEDQMDQQIYVPWERRGEAGEELFIAGQDTGQGETQVREQQQPLPGAAGPSLVPYQEVYGSYLDSANQALARESIPAGLQDYVRDYFTQLEP